MKYEKSCKLRDSPIFTGIRDRADSFSRNYDPVAKLVEKKSWPRRKTDRKKSGPHAFRPTPYPGIYRGRSKILSPSHHPFRFRRNAVKRIQHSWRLMWSNVQQCGGCTSLSSLPPGTISLSLGTEARVWPRTSTRPWSHTLRDLPRFKPTTWFEGKVLLWDVWTMPRGIIISKKGVFL